MKNNPGMHSHSLKLKCPYDVNNSGEDYESFSLSMPRENTSSQSYIITRNTLWEG